jgi:DNA-binding NtrC family response regulator
MNIPLPEVDEKAKEILLNYKWPGNVRELRNVVQRLIINSDGVITAKEISNPMILRNHIMIKEETNFEELYQGQVLPLKDMEKIFRVKYFKYVRSISSSDSSAAEKLGMAPSNFYRMCKELGIK